MRNATAGSRSSDDWHWKARRVLARFGHRTVPALVEALAAGDDPTIRQFAAESLGYLGREAQDASDALHHAARHDADRAVRAAAVAALKAIRVAGLGEGTVFPARPPEAARHRPPAPGSPPTAEP
jgi:hypothetical protein